MFSSRGHINLSALEAGGVQHARAGEEAELDCLLGQRDRQRIIGSIVQSIAPEHLARDPEPAGASSAIRKEG
jgi:hypothetical protein